MQNNKLLYHILGELNWKKQRDKKKVIKIVNMISDVTRKVDKYKKQNKNNMKQKKNVG